MAILIFFRYALLVYIVKVHPFFNSRT